MNFKNNPSTTFRDIHALTSAQASLEIQALREGIEYHNSLYYVKNRPKIADGVYDKLFRRLQNLEAAFPEFQSNTSPTQQVGAEPVEELKKIEHSAPMLSLNATLEKTEVKDFLRLMTREIGAQSIAYVLEPKFDGLSLEVVYEHGVFRRAATRGDGRIGEAVSANMKMIKDLPLRLRYERSPPRFLAVRGELFMNKDDFRQINKKMIEQEEDPFTNPRNAAAGIVRRLNPKAVEGRPLSIVFYDILKMEGAQCSSHWEEVRRLSEWGLMTDSHNARCTSFEEILTYHQKMEAERNDLNYEIDGVVIKLDDLAKRQALGVRQRSPRWALAWKFIPRQAVTTLEDIVVQVGMSGILTPVALLRPVDVGGVTISRATLHNEQEVRKKDLRPGDKVRVARAGDVIPEVVSRVGSLTTGRGKRFVMPDICPACGSRVRKEGAATICPAGLSCSAQLVGHLAHFASREAMNITGLGETTARQLVDSRLAKNIADLYDLSTEQFLQLDGFGQRSAAALYRAIQGVKDVPLDRFLYALGIPHVGWHAARTLALAYRTLDALQTAGITELRRVAGIGPEIARSVRLFFEEPKNRTVLDRLFKVGLKVRALRVTRDGPPLRGKTFVLTGKLDHYTRAEAREKLEALGARVASSVGATIDYLIVGADPGSKVGEAKTRAIPIIKENEFERLVS